ncbi:hypothetical protein Tco_0896711 [Tanacetum coccineum]
MESTCYHCSPKKDLYEVDYTQLYDLLKYNHVEVNELRAERLNKLIVVPGIANPNANQNGNGNVVAARAKCNGDLDKIKEFNEKCILIANLQQASTSGTQIDKALVYDSDGSVEVHHDINCYDNDIFNMFAQEE